MGGKWPYVSLETLAAEEKGAISIGPFGSRMKADVYVADGVPVIRGANITSSRWLKDDWVYVTEEFSEGIKNCVVKPGDLVFPHRGAIGEVALIEPQHGRMVLSTSMMKFRPDPEKADSKFLYYYFRSAQGRQEILRFGSQVGTPGIGQPLSSMRQFQVPNPPIAAQNAIGKVLGAFDDKIELNRQMNRTLEAMARAIFKAWFVDFEPVKAKAAGATSFRGMPQDVFDHLPARLTESELGPVPEGWEVGTLDDLVKERRSRVTPSNETYSMPYVPIDCITSKSISLEQSKSGGEARSSLIRFDEDDILFGAMRPYFHKVCLAPFSGTTRTTAFVLRPKQNNDLSFALLLLSEASTIDFATQHSVGSTIPYAKWENSLASMPIVYPDKSVRSAFHSIVGPFLDLTKGRYFENRTLSELRDTLLPKLISGEIRGPEVLGGADAG